MTKAEEKKLLVKIAALIDEAGEDSYIATAFKGAVLNAERNIRDDAAYSTADEAEHYQRIAEIESEQNVLHTERIEELEKQLADVTAQRDTLWNAFDNAKPMIYEAATARFERFNALSEDTDNETLAKAAKDMKNAAHVISEVAAVHNMMA